MACLASGDLIQALCLDTYLGTVEYVMEKCC